MYGPFGLGTSLTTTVAAGNQPITVATAILDSGGNYLQGQPLAGGSPLQVTLTDSNTAAGTIPATATIAAGSSTGTFNFTPKLGGGSRTILGVLTPAGGYMTPTQFTAISVTVN